MMVLILIVFLPLYHTFQYPGQSASFRSGISWRNPFSNLVSPKNKFIHQQSGVCSNQIILCPHSNVIPFSKTSCYNSIASLDSGSINSTPSALNQTLELHTSSTSTILSNINAVFIRNKLNSEFLNIAIPAFIGLAAEPLVAMIDSSHVGRFGAVQQAGMGIAISAQYSVSKLYNDPLLKTTTSLVAGKSGDELSASVATAISTAIVIGIIQSIVFLLFTGSILQVMGVSMVSDMRDPALAYLRWRALGVPAGTVLLVSNGIFRGRGDTKTPLYCTGLGNLVNILLDPILIFGCNMGCAGAGAAMAISQWVSAIPLLYLLNKSISFNVFQGKTELGKAFETYLRAGGHIFIRTIAKISAYTITASAAARLGSVSMAAYSMTFNLGFTAAQLCESVSIAAQALLARDMPLDSEAKRVSAAHVIKISLLAGFMLSGALVSTTYFNKANLFNSLTKSIEVRKVAETLMPIVLITQVIKGVSSATGGILLGGCDWLWSSLSMQFAALACFILVTFLPSSMQSIWIGLFAFMSIQVTTMYSDFLLPLVPDVSHTLLIFVLTGHGGIRQGRIRDWAMEEFKYIPFSSEDR